MLAHTPIQTLFYQYVAKRDPTDRYDWSSFTTCACGQFVREEEIDQFESRELYRQIWGRYPDDTLTPIGEPDAGSLNIIAYGGGDPCDWTFGALRERLEAAGYGN